MAYTGVLCTVAEMQLYACELVDSTGNVEANHNILAAQGESFLCVLSKYNWVDNYASLNVDVKRILSEYVARFGAVGLISFNMAGYTSRIEAEDIINIHLARMKAIEKILSDKDYINWIKAGGV